jgi:hypothetical protein
VCRHRGAEVVRESANRKKDRVLVESVQRGMRAGLLEHGRLLPESESLIAHLQGLVREALQS